MIASTSIGADIVTSRLGFGTSRLHYLDARKRQDLLAAALDLGVVHFDTAPAYGDGMAETELGRFSRGRRHSLVIASKYGIPANPIAARWPVLGRPVHILRALARRSGLGHPQLPPITAAGLRTSLEATLRRLNSDYVDILLLHQPALGRIPRMDECIEELKGLRQRGLVRAFGVAGPWQALAPLTTAAPDLAGILQTGETEWVPSSPPDIVYGAISRGSQSYFGSGIAGNAAGERLRGALMRRRKGVVLISTTKQENLQRLVETASHVEG